MSDTDYERWENLDNYPDSWTYRTEFMASLIEPNTSVLEFGAGRRLLEPLIPASCTYVPSDLTSRGPGTFVADLNSAELPALPQTDLAVFSGVLEYLDDLSRLAAALYESADHVLCSYVATEFLPDLEARRQLSWRNDFTADALSEIFVNSGFAEIERHDIGTQLVYRFRS